MTFTRIVNESTLDAWVRSYPHEAQGTIVELVERLVAASAPKPKDRRFPLGDSIGQHGADGFLVTEYGFDPYVPTGKSYWEIGTGTRPGAKATSDYRELSAATPESERKESTFVFVTPLSGAHEWQFTWKPKAQASWLKHRNAQKEWAGVRVIDGTRLVHWLEQFPPVQAWMARVMGHAVSQIRIIEEEWDYLKSIGDPPPLIPDLFLTFRSHACEGISRVLAGDMRTLQLDTHYPNQLSSFIAAYVANLAPDRRIEVAGTMLIVTGTQGMESACEIRSRQVLVLDFMINDDSTEILRLFERAHRAGHSVIHVGSPGGVPNPNRVRLASPNSHHVHEALRKAGYSEQRAFSLSEKCGGNLISLLRCIQGLSQAPEWAQSNEAADLAIAEILGTWTEGNKSDQAVVEHISGKAFGEWISAIRKVHQTPNTPLSLTESRWRFVPRFEGWFALGSLLTDDHITRIGDEAIRVLGEIDPKYDLDPNQRPAAALYDKVLAHSSGLRKGLADALALMGSHPQALASSPRIAEFTASTTVKTLLRDHRWQRWATLDELLPLLAEAAPEAFISSVEDAITAEPSPFDALFSQERPGIFGANYMSGLLWALETLAWSESYLTRVSIALGELSSRDPGGNYLNRPGNSLVSIYLPWHAQTCATFQKRVVALRALQSEVPHEAWKLLVNLLPSSHQTTMGSRKPAWRDLIPDDWTHVLKIPEYWSQAIQYADMLVEAAIHDPDRIAELIERIDDFPPASKSKLIRLVESAEVANLAAESKIRIWESVTAVVSRYFRYPDSKWSITREEIGRLERVVSALEPAEPSVRHKRLFSLDDFSLFEDSDDFNAQQRILDGKRERASLEVFGDGNPSRIEEFVSMIESPWRFGIALGVAADMEADLRVLPAFLSSSDSLSQFVGGYLLGRFRKYGWDWVDALATAAWTPADKAKFLAFLPFTNETWSRLPLFLAEDEALYWTSTTANPYDASDNLDYAIGKLNAFGRPREAIRCIERLILSDKPFDHKQAINALDAAVTSGQPATSMDMHAIADVITAIQNVSGVDEQAVRRIEWAYLQLLEHDHHASPVFLERELSSDPEFYCEVIRAIFRPEHQEISPEPATPEQKLIARNAYTLLSGWKSVPGVLPDGSLDSDRFDHWVQSVRQICSKTGHLTMGLQRLGHALAYAPPDPDGLWIHRSVARVLNDRDSKQVRTGFQVEKFNSRGTFTWTAGKAESDLSAEFTKLAEAVETAGFHRLAECVSEIAKSYRQDAERESTRDPLDD